jgi:hypothetical protein
MPPPQGKCPSCGSDCSSAPGVLEGSGKPMETTVWTCQARCGYRRWDGIWEKPKKEEPCSSQEG